LKPTATEQIPNKYGMFNVFFTNINTIWKKIQLRVAFATDTLGVNDTDGHTFSEIYIDRDDTGGNFAAGVNDVTVNLPLVLTTPCSRNLPPVSTTPMVNNGKHYHVAFTLN
jgi:hypothetical protein